MRARRRTPPRRDHASTIGRNRSKPFAASWSWTSCSQLLCVHRTCQRGVIDSTTVSGKASPPLVSVPLSGARPITFTTRTPLSASVSAGASPPGVCTPREMAIVAVEDQPHYLLPLRHVQRFLEDVAARLLSPH